MIKISHFALAAGVIACQMMTAKTYSQNVKWSPEQVFYGSGGKLSYTPDEQGNIIPDFSHVGYMYGDVEIPDVPTVVEVSPVDGDDGASIQAAINQVAAMSPDANGFRGALFLEAGIYQISGTLHLN